MSSQKSQKIWIDIGTLKDDLGDFFEDRRKDLNLFGSTVNQTFEAFVFASVASWYRGHDWDVSFVHPPRPTNQEKAKDVKQYLRLKFSTRGRPNRYTYVKCEKDGETVQVRHQLRVATKSHSIKNKFRANMVLDVAVIKDDDLSWMSTDHYIENNHLISFGEAKHMSAFAELVASFIGIVYEMQPDRLKRRRFKRKSAADRPLLPGHPSPFLFVSGFLFHTAQGIVDTIKQRGFDVDVFWRTNQLTSLIQVQGFDSK